MNQDPAEALAYGIQPAINTMGIDMGEFLGEWRRSKGYVEQYTKDFVELDKIVDGIPANFDPDVPYVGDTTLPGLVRAIMRSALQQLPSFSAVINGTKISVPAFLCKFFLKKYAFNEDTFGKGLLATLQIGGEQAISHGYAPFVVSMSSMFNDYGATLKLLHYGDTSPEPGIQDHNETGYDYVVANLTPTRVRRILKMAKNNPETTWNVNALQRVLDTSPKPTNYSQTQSPARANIGGEQAGPTYDFVTRYETGPDATNVTVCPDVGDEPLRVYDSNSKWGYPRVMYLVIDPAALTPFGTSRVRLASPNANLLNIYYGNIAAMLLLNSKPPVFKRGLFLKPVALKSGTVWETNDPNAEAKLMSMDNGALEQFQTMQQTLSGQIQNIMGNPTPLAGTPNNTFSKTGPGVKLQQQVMDTSTNQITKILENFLRQYALVALDTLLSEQEGEEDIIVDDETKDAINALAEKEFVPVMDPNTMQMTTFVPTIGKDNKIHVNWNELYDGIEDWSVDIDVSLSQDQLDDKKRADLQDMLVVLGQNAQTLGPQAVSVVEQLTQMLLKDTTPLVNSAPLGAAAPALSPPAGVLPGSPTVSATAAPIAAPAPQQA